MEETYGFVYSLGPLSPDIIGLRKPINNIDTYVPLALVCSVLLWLPLTSLYARLVPRSTASSSVTTSVLWVEQCTLPNQSSGSAVRAVVSVLVWRHAFGGNAVPHCCSL